MSIFKCLPTQWESQVKLVCSTLFVHFHSSKMLPTFYPPSLYFKMCLFPFKLPSSFYQDPSVPLIHNGMTGVENKFWLRSAALGHGFAPIRINRICWLVVLMPLVKLCITTFSLCNLCSCYIEALALVWLLFWAQCFAGVAFQIITIMKALQWLTKFIYSAVKTQSPLAVWGSSLD